MRESPPLLEIKHLTVGFHTEDGPLRAVDDFSMVINARETVCIVGESGSGKSVTALSILRLIEQEDSAKTGGQILFDGADLSKKSPAEMRRVRGSQIAMIFQEPMTALNPLMTIGDQIAEALLLHENRVTRTQALQKAVEMLRAVGMSEPEIRIRQYAHELSGGMRQRAMIAMAIVCNPRLLIADEPTTALDVTIQAQILGLLRELKLRNNMSLLLITHDMGVAAEMADRVVVLYAGKVMEEGAVEDIFDHPRHPYTIALLASIPGVEGEREARLHTIAGSIPNLTQVFRGCRFHPRCSFTTDRCRTEEPPMLARNSHHAACWNMDEVEAASKKSVAYE